MVIMVRLNVIFLLSLVSGCFGAADINNYLKVCSRNALDVNDCLVDAVQKGIASMIDGIPELDVPPIDPYLQKDYKVNYKNNQLSAKMTMKNIYVEGMKAAKVHNARLRADDDKFHLEVDLTSPGILVRGEYRGEGQFNALKIAAHGTFVVTMKDLIFTWKLDGVPMKNGTDTYVHINDFYMRPDVGSMFTDMKNENPETKELINLGIGFVNDNWRTLYRELLPYAQSNWKEIGISIANKIFLKTPYDQLFPTS